jgi:hypothetical protein
MAKITAYGAKEVVRYRVGNTKRAYVVCSDSRVLYRNGLGRFSLVGHYGSVEEAKSEAERRSKRWDVGD